jgi:hypothetical protein
VVSRERRILFDGGSVDSESGDDTSSVIDVHDCEQDALPADAVGSKALDDLEGLAWPASLG